MILQNKFTCIVIRKLMIQIFLIISSAEAAKLLLKHAEGCQKYQDVRWLFSTTLGEWQLAQLLNLRAADDSDPER
jgi:hypothetical protein